MASNSIIDSSKGHVAILGAVCLAAIALPLSFSGGAVATPAISRDLSGSPAAMNWITNAFMLAFGSLLMAAGALADQFGRRRTFSLGVGAFAVFSLALGLSPSLVFVDVLRALQGIAAAAALAGGTAALAQEFDGRARTRAFSLLGTTFGIGLAFGPVLAGFLVESVGWRAVFLTGAVAGALSLWFGVPRMRESRDPDAQGLDLPGTMTFTGALSCFTFGIIEAPERGWSSPLVVGLLAGAVVLAVVFVLVEMRVARPMLDLSLFGYPRFIGVQLLPVATCYCYIVLLVVLPLRLIGVDGYSEIDAGWLMLAISGPMLIVPVLAATLTRWISAGIVSGTGLLIAAAGLYWLAAALRGGVGSGLIAPMVAIGVGAGLPWGLMDGLSVSVIPKERAGMATGIFNTTRVAGEGVALAVVSAFLAVLTRGRLELKAEAPLHVSAAAVSDAAARLATGDLDRAIALLPEFGRGMLRQTYADAFGVLLIVLAVVTLMCAIGVLAFLGRSVEDAGAGQPASSDLPIGLDTHEKIER
jgi:MFS family permease